MKRKSARKEKVQDVSSDQENGGEASTENQDVDPVLSDEEQSSDDADAQPEPKKKKGEKRKSGKNFSDDEEASDADNSPEPKKKKGEKRKSEKNLSEEENSTDTSPTPDPKKKKGRKSATPKKPKKEQAKDEESDDEEDVQYEVEEIIDEKVMRGIVHYLIRWKGYDPESDTWEPEHTLECPELIKKFKSEKSNDENESPKKGKKDKNTENTPVSSKTSKKGKSAQNGQTPKRTPKSRNSVTGTGKKKSKGAPKVDWESDDEFEVDRILDVYFKKNGKREFLVSWKGYPSSQDSWEPEDNLECIDLIDKFMSKVDKAKETSQKELRVNRIPTERFTLNMADGNRRLSRRLGKKQRVQYHDAE